MVGVKVKVKDEICAFVRGGNKRTNYSNKTLYREEYVPNKEQ